MPGRHATHRRSPRGYSSTAPRGGGFRCVAARPTAAWPGRPSMWNPCRKGRSGGLIARSAFVGLVFPPPLKTTRGTPPGKEKKFGVLGGVLEGWGRGGVGWRFAARMYAWIRTRNPTVGKRERPADPAALLQREVSSSSSASPPPRTDILPLYAPSPQFGRPVESLPRGRLGMPAEGTARATSPSRH
jgi:hypothetical protein